MILYNRLQAQSWQKARKERDGILIIPEVSALASKIPRVWKILDSRDLCHVRPRDRKARISVMMASLSACTHTSIRDMTLASTLQLILYLPLAPVLILIPNLQVSLNVTHQWMK